MTMYRVAFDEGNAIAHIIGENASLPEGTREIGQFNATAVSPNPTDASIQHIHGMLYRAGVSDPTKITVKNEPIGEVIERREQPTATEMGEQLAQNVPPATAEIGVDESADLIDGSAKGYTFTISDEEVLKLDKRNGKITGLKPGTAIVTMTNGEGTATEVTVTVREPAAPEPEKEPEAE